MADRVDAAMNDMQTSSLHAAVDAAPSHLQRDQLRACDDAVLPLR